MPLNISNIELSDSFNTWRLRTNSIIARAAQATGSANNTANTIYSGRQTYNNVTTHNANTTHTKTLSANVITVVNMTGTNITGTTITATDFNSTSDVRLKININSIDSPIDKITRLNGVRFDWKDTNKPSIGLIAQEVEEVIPEVVHNDDRGMKTVNYGLLVAILIEAIKEQQKEINTLKAISQRDEDGN